MSIDKYIPLILILPPILYLVIAWFIKPPRNIIIFSFIGGLVLAVLNVLGDVVAHQFGWWRYPFTDKPYAPMYLYLAGARQLHACPRRVPR